MRSSRLASGLSILRRELIQGYFACGGDDVGKPVSAVSNIVKPSESQPHFCFRQDDVEGVLVPGEYSRAAWQSRLVLKRAEPSEDHRLGRGVHADRHGGNGSQGDRVLHGQVVPTVQDGRPHLRRTERQVRGHRFCQAGCR